MTADKPLRILIAEDEAIVALDIERCARSLGYEVVATTATAEEAVRIAGRERPDLILMDVRLRGAMDGIEAGRKIRDAWALPVVYLTAHADDSTVARAKETAPYGYLLKPFDEQKLRVTLELAIAKHTHEQAAERHRHDLLAVLNALPIGTILVDADGIMRFANDIAKRMLTIPERAIGSGWLEIMLLPAATRKDLAAQAAKASGSRRRVAVGFGEPAVTHIEIEIADDPRDRDGRILFLHDVSEVRALRNRFEEGAEFENMIGRSEGMQQVFRAISDLAAVDSSVLIRGETGTGKELVARALHHRSNRADGPFIAVNCGGLSDELALSQLFGYTRGAFTGAVADHRGYFEAANDGVLFLDEIGELSHRVQAGLLRVLEDGQVARVGENQPRAVNVRLLAATHRDLDHEIATGNFRADLYYRIRVAQIDLPPLHERREDIPLLTDLFLLAARATTGKQVTAIEDETVSVLLEYPWPGNIRELRNAIEFGVIRCRGETLAVCDLPPEVHPLENAIHSAANEEDRILAALTQARGQRKRAAELLGISRATFYRRIREYDIDLD